MTLKTMVLVSVRYLFYQPMDENIKTHWTLRFPAKENPKFLRRYCSIGQSCVCLTNQRNQARLSDPFDKPIKLHYFRSLVVSVLFARFHFKVIRKSFYLLWNFRLN